MVYEKSITCNKCKKLTPIVNIRADVNAKDWICKECYDIQFKKSKKLKSSVEEILARQQPKARDVIKPKPALKLTVKCAKCSYSFLVNPDNIPLKCVYCGREGTLRRSITAASILKEVEEEDRFYKKVK